MSDGRGHVHVHCWPDTGRWKDAPCFGEIVESAAEARLVQVTDPDCQPLLCVEKVFRPGFLTRLIYRMAFQAPFAYQYNVDAIHASFYRRRAAAAIVDAMLPEARVAQPLYVRWDHQSQALVLASEYIQGRGVIPAPVDPGMIRRWISGFFRKSDSNVNQGEEIHQLLDLMTRLEALLIRCGLTGSGWQVCKRAMVSTANLLRTDSGYVVVDLESGIPSVLVSTYILQGLRLQSLPPFDDLDAERLQRWLGEHKSQLAASLGEARHKQLTEDIESLISHTQRWKLSEPAIGRQPWRLLTADFFRRFRLRVLDRWQRCEIVDNETDRRLRNSRRFFTQMIFLLGLIPGWIGRFSQRLWANKEYRQHTGRLLTDSQFRRQNLRDYAETKSAQWNAESRIAPESRFEKVDAGFTANWMLSKAVPALMQRWMVDSQYRQARFTQMILFCVSGRFQSEFGRLLIRSRIEHWRKNDRLTPHEDCLLNRQLESTAVDEYVRGFGLHVGLKLLLPLVISLKIGGAAATMASGNPFYFLSLLMLVPILRTAFTLWRMLIRRQSPVEFRHALLVGMIPVAGSLAYPVQMYAQFPGLSMFLLRDFASRIGCWFPIYGGKDSRIELMAIKSVNVIAEVLDVLLAAASQSRGTVTTDTDSWLQADSPSRVGADKWDHLVAEQLIHIRKSLQETKTIAVTELSIDMTEERLLANDASRSRRAA